MKWTGGRTQLIVFSFGLTWSITMCIFGFGASLSMRTMTVLGQWLASDRTFVWLWCTAGEKTTKT